MSSLHYDTRINDDGSLACKSMFNFMNWALLLVYVVLIILFSYKYRIVATIFMVVFMSVMKLSKTLCPQTHWTDLEKYGFILLFSMIMYIGMLGISWIPIDNMILRVIANAIAPLGMAYLGDLVPGLAYVYVLPTIPFN